MQIEIKLHDSKAVVPTKAHQSDVGWDIHAISVDKILTFFSGTTEPQVILYDTGISVKPPEGYYIEILPRSSISKTGNILANNVGVIDPDYRGTLKIAVARLSQSSQLLQPPFCKFQIVLRSYLSLPIVIVEDIPDTERGIGGFGSSDK